jgi:hypothetical protein
VECDGLCKAGQDRPAGTRERGHALPVCVVVNTVCRDLRSVQSVQHAARSIIKYERSPQSLQNLPQCCRNVVVLCMIACVGASEGALASTPKADHHHGFCAQEWTRGDEHAGDD